MLGFAAVGSLFLEPAIDVQLSTLTYVALAAALVAKWPDPQMHPPSSLRGRGTESLPWAVPA
jgi:hypothetical protein